MKDCWDDEDEDEDENEVVEIESTGQPRPLEEELVHDAESAAVDETLPNDSNDEDDSEESDSDASEESSDDENMTPYEIAARRIQVN